MKKRTICTLVIGVLYLSMTELSVDGVAGEIKMSWQKSVFCLCVKNPLLQESRSVWKMKRIVENKHVPLQGVSMDIFTLALKQKGAVPYSSMKDLDMQGDRVIWYLVLIFSFFVLWAVLWNKKLSLARKKTEHALFQLQQVQMQLQQKNEALESLAITDSVTGLFNGEKLGEILTHETARSRRFQVPFGVVMLSLDQLSKVRKAYGNEKRDAFLQEVALLLQKQVRRVDYVGRWRNDLFLVICPNGTIDGLFTLSEHLRKSIEKQNFTEIGQGTASLGFALFQEDDDQETLLARAGRGLVRAQFFGRNRVGMAES